MVVNLTDGNTLLGGRQNEKDVKGKKKTILESLIANSDVFFSRTHKQIAIDDSSDCILGRRKWARTIWCCRAYSSRVTISFDHLEDDLSNAVVSCFVSR